MLKDGQITIDEVNSLRYWLEEHRDLSGNYPFDKAFNAVDSVLEDGQITVEEFDNLKKIFADIVDPVKSRGCHDKIITMTNKHVCLTGEFDFGEKKAVGKLIEEAGGTVDNAVKKSTDYVVVGAKGSEAWKTGNYGGKIQKALEYNEKYGAKGINIKIVQEYEFIYAIQYMIEHPDEYLCNSEDKTSDYDWKTSVQAMLNVMIREKELPEGSLYLAKNYGRDGKTVTSYSVCIYEPDYPKSTEVNTDSTRNSIVLNIKEGKTNLELLVGTRQFDVVGEPVEAEIKTLKSDKVNVHVIFPVDSKEVVLYIQKNVEYALVNYTSMASSFGCCSQFIACSDAKKCVHENKLYSKACIYRGNLEAGRIFYGKNRNID